MLSEKTSEWMLVNSLDPKQGDARVNNALILANDPTILRRLKAAEKHHRAETEMDC